MRSEALWGANFSIIELGMQSPSLQLIPCAEQKKPTQWNIGFKESMSPNCLSRGVRCPGTCCWWEDNGALQGRWTGACSSPALVFQCQDKAWETMSIPQILSGTLGGASTGMRSHRSSSGSFLHHQGTWARTEAKVEPSGGSGRSFSNISGIEISLKGALTTRGPVPQIFQQVLKLTFWAEHHTWFQSFHGMFPCAAHQGNDSSGPAAGGLRALSFLSFWPLNIIHLNFYEAIHIQILLEVEGPFISSVYSAHRELVLPLILFLCFLCFNNDLPSSIWLWIDEGDTERYESE